jgi:GT2 family glycosyltransferase
MIPKTLYIESGGCRRECDGAQDFDLCLRLDLLDAKFMNVPFFLYAWRSHSQSTAKNTGNKNYAHHAGIHALTDYTTKKGLNWQITDGYSPTSYRAIPQSTTTPTVHAIMLFKDQKDITIKSIQSLIAQTNVHVLITAIDNDSTDLSIGNLLETMGVEVLRIEEPFNYSRLNNIAVTHSMYKHKYPLLFINNDVILNPNAVKEMTRWVYEKNIGMVGCRLHYPDGTLQHGGVDLKADEPGNLMSWSHSECLLPFTRTSTAKITRTVDAVTAACSLIPYDVFTKVGGFDDIHYPIAFSDTNLAVKIRKAGFICIYTPYATGTHHESLSRSKYNIEDYEGSYWLHRQLNNSVTTSSFYFN